MSRPHRKDNAAGKKRHANDLDYEGEEEGDSAQSIEASRKRVRWGQDDEVQEGEGTQDESESEDSSPEKVR